MNGGLTGHIVVRRSDSFLLDVTLEIPAGRTLALVGPNGAGKSTVARALAGLIPLDSGRIALADVTLDDAATGLFVRPEERRVGMVFQDHLLFPHMTALQNVAFGLRSRGRSRADAHRVAGEWLGRFDLADMSGRRPGQLSGGQAQRVALARALASDPALLLLDEPMAALDVRTRAEVRGLLARHLAEFPGPRLLITHDPFEAFELADEVCVIENGRLTQTGSVEELRMRPRSPWAAELAGSNLFVGQATVSGIEIGGLTLTTASPELRGRVRVSIRPNAVSVHRSEPGGSPRNRWRTTVARMQDNGASIRLLTGDPLPMMIDLTPGARSELGLAIGGEIWVSLKATEISVEAIVDGATTD